MRKMLGKMAAGEAEGEEMTIADAVHVLAILCAIGGGVVNIKTRPWLKVMFWMVAFILVNVSILLRR